MKLRYRYPHLQNPAVVKAMVVQSVYASMALEDQTVPVERLEALYALTEPVAAAKLAAEAARSFVSTHHSCIKNPSLTAGILLLSR